MRTFAATVAMAILLLGTSHAERPQPREIDRMGPQVGERVPPFALTDQHGREQTLASIMGPKGAMVVFFRSADW